MNGHNIDTADAWRKLLLDYTGDGSLIDGLYQELYNYYSEPHRFYHNLAHVGTLLQLYYLYETKLKKRRVVLFSIFYHDVVYTPGKGDNEYQSWLLAKRALEQLRAPAGEIKDVQMYIQATSGHNLPPSAETDLKYFIDFDLSILAAEREAYKAYLLSVRKEFSYLSSEHFAWGRKSFIQNMLNKTHIFYTEEFGTKEEAARKNMQWELEMSPGIFSAR